MKFGQEIQRIANTPLAKDAQLQDALLPYKTLKKQIKHNGCIEPHVDTFAAPELPMPGEEAGVEGAGHANAQAPSEAKVDQLLETSPFLRFLEGELRSVTKTIEDEAQRLETRRQEAATATVPATTAQNQELATSAQALHMVFTTNQTALRKILKKFDVCRPPPHSRTCPSVVCTLLCAAQVGLPLTRNCPRGTGMLAEKVLHERGHGVLAALYAGWLHFQRLVAHAAHTVGAQGQGQCTVSGALGAVEAANVPDAALERRLGHAISRGWHRRGVAGLEPMGDQREPLTR
jgi:hypothetical protein